MFICRSQHRWHINFGLITFLLTNDFCITEPYAGEFKAVRLDLQQQVVHGHLDHPLPEQEGSVWGEDPQVATDHLLRRLHGWVSLVGWSPEPFFWLRLLFEQEHKSTARRLPTFRRSSRPRTSRPPRRSTAIWRVLRIPTTSSSCLTLSPTSS